MLTDRQAIETLGGAARVVHELRLKRSAVTMWGTRRSIPPEHHLPMWRLCQQRGIDWAPPGAEGCALVPPVGADVTRDAA
jgi:hypothetical protein